MYSSVIELSRRRLGLVGLDTLVLLVDGSGGNPWLVDDEAAEAGLGTSRGVLGSLGGRASRPPRIEELSAASLLKPSPDERIVGLMAGL